ncbi:Uncharacterised protein [uncultured archaeon]|nr:Uncharacterised protein [uncultured archaeon]
MVSKIKKKNNSLDYLLVPSNWKEQRRKRVIEELKKRKVKNIRILNGFDSEEDILYLGKKLKGKEKIGFVTFPLHYLEYKEIIKKAIKEKKFPKNVKIENIATEQKPKQFIYGVLGLLDEKLKRRKLDYFNNRLENPIVFHIRKFFRTCLLTH